MNARRHAARLRRGNAAARIVRGNAAARLRRGIAAANAIHMFAYVAAAMPRRARPSVRPSVHPSFLPCLADPALFEHSSARLDRSALIAAWHLERLMDQNRALLRSNLAGTLLARLSSSQTNLGSRAGLHQWGKHATNVWQKSNDVTTFFPPINFVLHFCLKGMRFFSMVVETEQKIGKISQNEMDSALVDLSVLISNFFRKLLSNFAE